MKLVPEILARDIVRYLSFFGTGRAKELADALQAAPVGAGDRGAETFVVEVSPGRVLDLNILATAHEAALDDQSWNAFAAGATLYVIGLIARHRLIPTGGEG